MCIRDRTVTLATSATSIAENSASNLTLTATLSGATFQDVTVSISTSGTATEGTDYATISDITISAGSTTGTAVFNPTDDSDETDTVTATVAISGVSGGGASESGSQSVTISILDDESVPRVSLTVSATSIAENAGSSLTLTATLSKTATENVTVTLGTSGTATEGTDYGSLSNITVTAGDTTSTVSFTPSDDSFYDASSNETAVVAIDSVSGGDALEDGTQSVTITITDNESAPTVTLATSATSIAENAGSSLTLTATLSNATYQDVTVALGTSGAATEGTDYTDGSGNIDDITISAGSTTATVSFTPTDDSFYDATSNETATISVTGVDNTLTSGLFGNWASLGQAGITFNFPGSDARFSKTYHISNFSTGSGTPTLPSNTDLGLGAARYNSSNTTITFVLKQANIPTASDVSTSSGTGVSILDNLEDLNGRKYITHRIERADGYSLQFVVRANISEISASLNPTGDQSVVGSNNYVLASLRNSPYGFTAINQSDRYRDGAENIKNNMEFIAQEATAYVKYYYESSATRGTALTIGGTSFGQVAATVARNITSWAVTGDKCKIKVQKGHNLYPSFTQHTPTAATYTATSGNLVATVNTHGFEVGDLVKFDPGAFVFRCSMDDYSTLHAYPRQGDPAADKWLKITAKTTNTFQGQNMKCLGRSETCFVKV